MNTLLLAVVGLFGGFASGLLGIGGGVLFVPIFHYMFGVSLSKAIGTSIMLIAATTIASSMMHWYNGFVDFKIFFICCAFAVAGGLLGAWSVKYISPDIVRKIFAVVLFLIAIKMFIGGRVS